MESYLNF
jgi:hypothetical protein